MYFIFGAVFVIVFCPMLIFVIMKYGAYGWFRGKRLAERHFKKDN